MRRLGILARHLRPQEKAFPIQSNFFQDCNALCNSSQQIKIKNESFVCKIGVSALSKEKSLQQILEIDPGEDSYFVAPTGAHNNFSRTFGVADGVGGWRDRGIDPSAMSNALMKEVFGIVKSNPSQNHNPKTILIEAFQKVVSGGTVEAGSTTVCIATLNGNHLKVANLGDSGVRLLRKSKLNPEKYECVHETKEQTHFFNAPYQIGIIPKSMSQNALQDTPHDAELYSFEIQEGDVIICATDGLYDNIFTEDICEIATQMEKDVVNASKEEKKIEFVKVLAMALVLSARQVAVQKDITTPFSARAQQGGYAKVRGGKLDDVTVVVAQVQHEHE